MFSTTITYLLTGIRPCNYIHIKTSYSALSPIPVSTASVQCH